MATIKSFTDISQSKTLSKILPLESADMHYATWTILDGEFIVSPNQGDTIESLQEDYGEQIIPCWSLAALLEIIRNNGRYELQMYEGGYYFESGEFMTESYFNPVDACYELMLKLHE